MIDPQKVCDAIRNSFKDAEFVYKNGSCYEFFKILRTIYPDAKPWTDIDHVWTELNGKFYDIDGLRIEGSEGLMDEACLFKKAHRWSSRSTWRIDEAKEKENE